MAEKVFAPEPGGAPRLAVSWSGGFKDLAISLDGQPAAAFDDPKELKEPQRVPLPDGSTLEVQVASPFLFPELRLLRDGEPVPGSSADPATRHTAAWQVLAAVAVLNVVVGLLVEVFDAGFLRGANLGPQGVRVGAAHWVSASPRSRLTASVSTSGRLQNANRTSRRPASGWWTWRSAAFG